MSAQIMSVAPPTRAASASAQRWEEPAEAYTILSSVGGAFAADENQRRHLCLLSTGELLVLSSSGFEHSVMEYEAFLRTRKHTFVRRTCLASDLLRLYGRGVVANGKTEVSSDRQARVVSIFADAVKKNASDIHFVIRRTDCTYFYRVDGVLEKQDVIGHGEGPKLLATIYQSMMDVADATWQPHKPQDGRVKEEYVHTLGLYGARIATRPTDGGMIMIVRLLTKRLVQLTLEDLGWLDQQIDLIDAMVRRTTGVNVFSGPTGSGKSTSLEVLLKLLIKHFNGRKHVITFEDPPEYEIVGANQTPVIKHDWAGAIRNAMRLDPDVMMVGEMRDQETVQATFQAALTGHGVWTTLHANDAVTILQRLDDLKLDKALYLDPSLVTGLIAQRLVRKLCPHCKVSWSAARATQPKDLVERVERLCAVEHVRVASIDGCVECNKKGYKGRSVIGEIIVPNLKFMRVYRDNGKAEAREYWIRHMGGITKNAHLIQMINKGLVDPAMGEESVDPIDADDIFQDPDA